MKRLLPLLFLILIPLGVALADQDVNQEARMIRRAFLDVIGLLPTPEEIDWYLVYNQNGYSLAVNFLMQKGPVNGIDADFLVSPEYRTQPERVIERSVLQKNVSYLAGVFKGGMTDELFEKGAAKFIDDALLVSDGLVSGAIDYMVNSLVCRSATAAEVNELSAIYNQVSLKSDDMQAWRTVLSHILEMHDCKYK